MKKLFILLILLLTLPFLATGQLILNDKKAFPAAFGAGQDLTGGEGGSYYAVTNSNDSGAGSFREALNQGDGTIIIIKAEGIVNLTSDISGTAPDDITIWGQFAPGNGLTLTGDRVTFEGASNHIVRFMTFQNDDDACTNPTAGGSPCRSAVAWRSMNDAGGQGVYIDHISARYGMDQTIDIGHEQPTMFSTMAYNFMGTGVEGHNTGGFAGGDGRVTYARNVAVSITHRFAIHSGGDIENYNNFITNYGSRIANARVDTQIDYFHNYLERGNASGPSSSATNKLEGSNIGGMRTYTADNYHENNDLTPNGLQTNLWQNRGSTNPEGSSGPIDNYHYVSQRLNNFGDPADGIWDWSEVKSKALAAAGHNRGINADGTPGYFRDDVDDDFATRAINGTTRSTRLPRASFYNSTLTGTSLYSDTDGDYMPDWFENQHSHLNPNSSADRDGTNTNWTFAEYTVTNNAGYTNLEMCAAFYAGDFETMLTGKNDLTYTDPGGGGTVDVVSVSLDKTNVTGEVDDTFTLTATINPSNADTQTVTWSSSNVSLATVDASTDLVMDGGTHVAEASDLTTNGLFTTDTDWTKQTGWTISGGTASADGTATGNGKSIVQDMGIAVGPTYDISYRVSNYDGTNGFAAYAGGYDSGDTHFADGRYTDRISATNPSSEVNVYIQAKPGTTMDLDSVTVREVPTVTVTTDDGSFTASSFITTITPSVASGESPVAQLIGPSNLRLRKDETYVEFGCECIDPEDGTFDATFNTPVDTSTLGSYTVTYSCDDNAGNPTVQTTREVYVDSWPVQSRITNALWNSIYIYLNLGQEKLE